MQLRLHINDTNDPQELAAILRTVAETLESFGKEPLTHGMMRVHKGGYFIFQNEELPLTGSKE